MATVYNFKFTANATSAEKVFSSMKRSMKDIDSQFASVQKRIKSLNSTPIGASIAKGLKAGLSAAGDLVSKIAEGARNVALSFVTINMDAELLRAKLTTITGSVWEGEKAFQMMLVKATEMPFTIDSIVDSFAKLKAAGIDDAVKYVDALTNSISAFGGSSEDLRFATMAIQQMVGKGVISMEEMRRQLAERIPTAMGLMADAVGMSIGELTKVISAGNASTAEFLDPMIDKMNEVYAGANARMMDTFSGSLQKVRTAWTRFIIAIGDGEGAFQGLKGIMDSIAIAMNNFRNSAEGVEIMNKISSSIREITDGLSDPKAMEALFTNIVDGINRAMTLLTPFRGALVDLVKLSEGTHTLGFGRVKATASGVSADAFDSSKYLKYAERIEAINKLISETSFFDMMNNTDDIKGQIQIIVESINQELDGKIVAKINLEKPGASSDVELPSISQDSIDRANELGDTYKSLIARQKELTKASGDASKKSAEYYQKAIDLESKLVDEQASRESQIFQLKMELVTDDEALAMLEGRISDLQVAAANVDLSKIGGFEAQRDMLLESKRLIESLSMDSQRATKEDVAAAAREANAMVDRARRHSTSSTREQANDAIKEYDRVKDSYNGIFEEGDKKAFMKDKIAQMEAIGVLLSKNRTDEIDHNKKMGDLLDQQRKKYDDLYSYIEDRFKSFSKNKIEHLKYWKSVLEGVNAEYKDILDTAKKISDLPAPSGDNHRAMGGPVSQNETYIVGEKGPELFTPNTSGNITPNNQLKGSKSITSNLSITLGGQQMPTIQGATKQSVDSFISELQRSQRLAA